jgi:hypothetical protein
MTAAQMLAYFDQVQDKNSEPYFTSAEKYLWLNAAQADLFEELVGGGDVAKPVMAQLDERAGRLLEPFIYTATAVADASGIITYAALKTDIGSTENVVTILDVHQIDSSDKWAAQYRKPQEFRRSENNSFLAGTAANDSSNYTYSNTGILVSPSVVTWDVVCVKYPADISASQDCEFPEDSHYKVVAKALEKAGIATEAEGYSMINQVTS